MTSFVYTTTDDTIRWHGAELSDASIGLLEAMLYAEYDRGGDVMTLRIHQDLANAIGLRASHRLGDPRFMTIRRKAA